jgi:protein phosphatase
MLEAFVQAFAYMPLTAVIGQTILCVHGGLGPGWLSILQTGDLQRPIHDFGDALLESMVWSDPSSEVDMFHTSTRGAGYLFGEAALKQFLDANCLTRLVRGHQCVNSGCQFSFNDCVITVFSASNYVSLGANKSGVLEVREDGTLEPHSFPPLEYIERNFVKFGKLTVNGTIIAHDTVPNGAPSGSFCVPKLPPLGSTSCSFRSDPRAGRQTTSRALSALHGSIPTVIPGLKSPMRL